MLREKSPKTVRSWRRNTLEIILNIRYSAAKLSPSMSCVRTNFNSFLNRLMSAAVLSATKAKKKN